MNHQSRFLTLALCLALAGCSGAKQKTTWQKVREIKPDSTSATADAYVNKVHKMLAENKVEHKVVTYQFRYQTRMREEALGTRTAVIYKDNSNPKNPWWLVDERAGKPMWLPGMELDRQVAFYLHRKADVTEQKVFPGGESEASGTMVAKQAPAAPARAQAPTQIATTNISPVTETAHAQAAPKAGPAPFIRPARFSPESRGVAIPYTAPAPAESHYDSIFRRVHGTDYDPSSPTDRRKMKTIKQALLDTRGRATARTC